MSDSLAIPRLLTTAQAMEALSISRTKLWELTNRGDIPTVRIGRAIRFDPVDLKRWIDRNKTKPVKKEHNAL